MRCGNSFVLCTFFSVDPGKPLDFKEAYDITEPYNNSRLPWPDGSSSDFRDTVKKFFQTCENLTHRILDLVCLGLTLKVCHTTVQF